jgi:signal transduction histidine kinase
MSPNSPANNQSKALSSIDRQLKERLLLQNRMQQELLIAGDPQTVAEIGLRYLRQLLPAQRASVLSIDLDSTQGRILAMDADNLSEMGKDGHVPLQRIDLYIDTLLAGNIFYANQGDDDSQILLISELGESGIRSFLSLPLQARGELIGILNLSGERPHQFNEDHISLAKEIAAPIALALHQAELYRTEKEQRLLAEALTKTGNALSATLEFEEILDQSLEQIARVVPFDTASILMFSGSEAYVARHKGFSKIAPEVLPNLPHLRFPIADTATIQQAFKTRAPIVISDVNQFPGWVQTASTYYIRSWASVPIIIQDEFVALICVDNHRPNFYQQHHVDRLGAFANQAGLAWQNARFHQATTRQLGELRVLHEVAIAGAGALTVDEFIARVTTIIGENLYPQHFGILLLDAAGGYLTPHPSSKMSPGAKQLAQIPITEGIVGHVARTKRPNRHGSVHETSFAGSADPHTRSQLCVPILIGERILGVINTESALDDAFSAADEQLLTTNASQLATGIDKLRYANVLATRVQERTQELAAANEGLMELDRMKSKFVADVSHELRTPLTNLRLYLDLFSHAPEQKQQKYLDILRDQVGRLSSLVDEILSLSRIELGRDKIQFETVDLNNIIAPIVEAHQPQIAAQGLDLAIALQDELPLISGEPNQLAQVVTNLLANAIRYTSQGRIEIRTWFDREQNMVFLQIEDSGIGFEEEELPYLFQRFYRGQRVSQLNIPGTGLGLAIVQEIIKLHRGTISLRHGLDQGAVVQVALPSLS